MNKKYGCPKCGSIEALQYTIVKVKVAGIFSTAENGCPRFQSEKYHTMSSVANATTEQPPKYKCFNCNYNFDEPAEVKDEKESDN